MKPVWIVLLCLLGAAVLAALVWLLVWYIEQRVLAKSLGRASEGADAQAAWEQHILRKQDWTADSEPGRAALARVRAGVAAMQEQPHEDVFLPALDGARLHARLYRVPHAHATVILCHGYHSHAEHDFSAQFPALYASGGCNLLLIDERAHGLSEGKCLTFGQLERYDIAQWVHWVREHSRVQRPIALYGVSMGAASVLLAAQLPELRDEIACVIADCGYSSFELGVTDAGLRRRRYHARHGGARSAHPVFPRRRGHFRPPAPQRAQPRRLQAAAAARRHPRRGARHVRAGRPRALPA